MAGKKTFVAGEVLLAQDVNDFLMDQTVMNFTTVAARSSAIPTPTTGMVSYVGDTGSDSATNATIVDVPQIQAYTGSAWQNVDGLTLVAKATIGTTVSSVVMNNVFSANFDNYRIVLSGGAGSTTNIIVLFRFDAVASGYSSTQIGFGSFGVAGSGSVVGGATDLGFGESETNYLQGCADVFDPFLTRFSGFSSMAVYNQANNNSRLYSGRLNTLTSYTGFTIFPNAGTITGGTIYVYGYRKS
jgi:hypothetical protein